MKMYDTLTEQTVRARARKGAKACDKTWSDWAERVNLDTFTMDDASLCVLGQVGHENWLSSGYVEALAAIGASLGVRTRSTQWQNTHGFDVQEKYGLVEGTILTRSRTFRVLEDQWRREIAKRKKASTA